MFTREEVLTLLEKWMAKEEEEAQGEENYILRGYRKLYDLYYEAVGKKRGGVIHDGNNPR